MHVLCAVWASEVRFGDEVHMRNVSGIESIPDNMRKYKCFLCHKTGSYVLTVGERGGFDVVHASGVFEALPSGVRKKERFADGVGDERGVAGVLRQTWEEEKNTIDVNEHYFS